MSNLFWGLRLDPGKRYSTTVDKSFHVSMAALDCSSVMSDEEVLSVMIDEGESDVPFILCNLQKSSVIQSPLDLNFMTGDRITIYCKGSGVVHLSGYIVLDDVVDDLEQFEEEEEDDDDEEAEASDNEELQLTKGKGNLNGFRGKRNLEESSQRQSKRKKLQNLDEDTDLDSDDEDDDDDFGSDDIEDESMALEGDESDDDDDDDEEDDDEEDDDDDDESDDEETKLTAIKQQDKKTKKNKAQGNQQKGPKQNIPKQQNANTSKQQSQQSASPTAQGKKQNQLNSPNVNKQQNKGKQQQKTINGVTPNTKTKKDKKKGGDKSPAGTTGSSAKLGKSGDETTASPAAKKGAEETSPVKKTLEGGLIIRDIKIGNGQACKSGKMACVYYTGRLKQNNKVFDSTTDGAGFKFRVGKGEVIKGWDVGIIGMKVGGKRSITCPPPMAYGQKGSPPTIPANSTLVFEVELKSLN